MTKKIEDRQEKKNSTAKAPIDLDAEALEEVHGGSHRLASKRVHGAWKFSI